MQLFIEKGLRLEKNLRLFLFDSNILFVYLYKLMIMRYNNLKQSMLKIPLVKMTWGGGILRI